jgi:hypothetical protein
MRGGGKDHRLDDDSYYEFKDILDSLTIEKESIKNGMGFAFDHLDAHQEVRLLAKRSTAQIPDLLTLSLIA